MLSDAQRLMIAGILINSALYLTGIYWAGMIYHVDLAWKCALACAGVSYFSYFVQLWLPGRIIGHALVALSVMLGAVGGLALVV